MSTSRRKFLKTSAAAGGAIALGALPKTGHAEPGPDAYVTPDKPVERAAKPLKILILGGTGFTGPEQVEYAIARGHSVTLINRNKTRPDFFKGRVEQLIGDFNGDMSALKGLKFDVVIDNPTTLPAWVKNVSQYMIGKTDHYIFISTISAYANDATAWADETDATHPLPAGFDPYNVPPAEARSGRNYGVLKAQSERDVQKYYAGKSTIIRPGLIVGPLDATNRFTYWPYRIEKGGEVLAPGDGNDPVQFIDSRDLAEWTVRMAENKTFGVFNGTGPEKNLTMAEMLYGIKGVTTAGAHFTWVPVPFLNEQKIRGWSNMPVWVPDRPPTEKDPGNAAWSRRSIKRALDAGLTFRSLAVTTKDTLDWNKTRTKAELDGLAAGTPSGVSAEREAEVLAAWKAKKGDAKPA